MCEEVHVHCVRRCMCVLCERKIVNSKSTYVHPHSLASSHPHTLTSSHIHTIIEAINSCLEVMQENSRSHVPCEEGRGEGVEEGKWREERGKREGRGGERRGSGGRGSKEEDMQGHITHR